MTTYERSGRPTPETATPQNTLREHQGTPDGYADATLARLDDIGRRLDALLAGIGGAR